MNQMSPDKQRLASSIAMTILLISFSMLFAVLFLGYAVFRVQNESWPPMGMPHVPLIYPLSSTLLILASSFTYWRFQRLFFEKASLSLLKLWLGITLFFGLAFVGSQWVLWESMWEQGLYVSAGIFPSLIHGFTWVHVAHMALAMFALIFLYWKIRGTDYGVSDETKVVNIGKFWHFLDIVWLAMFGALFVI